MTSENEATARSALAAFSRGDLDACLATLAPDVEWHIAFRIPDLPPDVTVLHGHDSVRELWKAFRSAWDELTVEIEEVLHDADDVLVARARFHGRGAGSGIEIDRMMFYVLDLDEGLLTTIRPFDDLEEARRAAGLRE